MSGACLPRAMWAKVLTRHGVAVTTAGAVTEDPFCTLANRAAVQAVSGVPTATVSVTLGASSEFSRNKVSVTLTVPVACNEVDISAAGEVTYVKAHQMLTEAAESMGVTVV